MQQVPGGRLDRHGAERWGLNACGCAHPPHPRQLCITANDAAAVEPAVAFLASVGRMKVRGRGVLMGGVDGSMVGADAAQTAALRSYFGLPAWLYCSNVHDTLTQQKQINTHEIARSTCGRFTARCTRARWGGLLRPRRLASTRASTTRSHARWWRQTSAPRLDGVCAVRRAAM